MQIGIVGLPFSGKSTLFQTITRTHLDQAALAKAEAHHAMVRVPDRRLDRLNSLFNPRSSVYAALEFVDVVGLKKGETGSTQFTTNFLASVKNNDALVQVVRTFAEAAVPHPEGSVDPLRDVATFETEFLLADMAILESRVDRVKKQIGKHHDDVLKRELPVLEKCRQVLERERPLREEEWTKDELQLLRSYQLLTLKPMLIALNGDEGQLTEMPALVQKVAAAKAGRHTHVLSFFGRVEQEMSELDDADAVAFMQEYGITESALTALIRESYTLLGLRSFFTVGEDECRAWTIRAGMTAQDAAGVIHTDFFNKFIRAEAVQFDDFVLHEGSFAKAKEAGHWRLEGKEYEVKDGDILSIRHN
ncbi:MAG: redox-regulated ATPase YchF [Bacteroidota bacterium]